MPKNHTTTPTQQQKFEFPVQGVSMHTGFTLLVTESALMSCRPVQWLSLMEVVWGLVLSPMWPESHSQCSTKGACANHYGELTQLISNYSVNLTPLFSSEWAKRDRWAQRKHAAHTRFLPAQREFRLEIHYLVIWFSLATVILILITSRQLSNFEFLQHAGLGVVRTADLLKKEIRENAKRR